jgi:hypothetical protein
MHFFGFQIVFKVFCELHYHAERMKSAPRCSVCNIAVTSYTKLDGAIYCEKDKPRCDKCQCELGSFVQRGSERFCPPCAKKTPPTKLLVSSSPVAASSAPTPRFCARCGIERGPNAKFCAGCGNKH